MTKEQNDALKQNTPATAYTSSTGDRNGESSVYDYGIRDVSLATPSAHGRMDSKASGQLELLEDLEHPSIQLDITTQHHHDARRYSTRSRVRYAFISSSPDEKQSGKKSSIRIGRKQCDSPTFISATVVDAIASASPIDTRDLSGLTQTDVFNLMTCSVKDPAIPPMVADFCARENMMVPSNYATHGWADPDYKDDITI
ncbi:hypothetical protein H2203_003850 [Taxawa tesnikishii (nom. ined.)]|nr:hypothetical protein H2203_003850 [Dothideales sp. JES 119]